MSDHVSSTHAELLAIVSGLRLVHDRGKDLYVFVDSQSALSSLSSKTPLHEDITEQCRSLVSSMEQRGHRVQFEWIPSHIGLTHNERVDRMANAATRLHAIAITCQQSLQSNQYLYWTKRF